MSTQKLHLWDRSRTYTDWSCPRKRYWNYHAIGKGLVRNNTSLELYLGTTVHDALAAIATLTKAGLPVNIDEIAEAAATQMRDNLEPRDGEVADVDYQEEQAALVEGLIRGYYQHVWPRLLEEYPNILFVEEEMEFKHDLQGQPSDDGPLLFMSKPDLIVGNNLGDTVYVEFKTTSSKKDQWINSWETAVQLHSTIRAVYQTTGLEVNQVIVQGLYKGYESYGKQSSPMCYAYKKFGNPPFSLDQVSYEYKAGFKRFPTWQMEGGVKAWVESMPDNILADLYPQTPPILLNEDLIDAFFRQRAKREAEIGSAIRIMSEGASDDNQALLDKVFPQKFDSCNPGWGFSCSYRQLCHGYVADPLDEGFEPRESHHKAELEQHAGK